MYKWAGVTLDFHDDGGATLKRLFPSADDLPDVIKTACVQPPEKLANEQFALVASDSGHLLRKLAMNDAGTTAMSVIYFMEHGDKLPDPARKMAANRLVDACGRFGMLAPEALVKIAADPQAFRRQQQRNAIEDVASIQRAHAALAAGGLGGLAGAGAASQFGGGPKAQLVAGGLGALAGGTAGYLAQRRSHQRYGVPLQLRARVPLPEKTAGVEQAGLGAALQQALQQHEARETPEQEALERATGMEANPDDIVGPGPAAFMPGANINPELLDPMQAAMTQEPQAIEQAFGDEVRPVDLTGQQPVPKLAARRPRNDEDYAVVLSDGRRLYPIDSWDNVKIAHQYYEENERRMEPGIRHEFAANLVTKAASLGYNLPESILEAGSRTYADDGHLRASLEMRKVAFKRGSAEQEFLDELMEKKAEISAPVFAECLRRFDVMNGLDRAWDVGFLDPWSSTYGLVKNANKVVWEDGAERITEGELQNLSTNGSIPLQTVFTPIFAAEFQKDPLGVFESMPEPQKRIIARMAVDVSSQGGSEGEVSRANVVPLRRAG